MKSRTSLQELSSDQNNANKEMCCPVRRKNCSPGEGAGQAEDAKQGRQIRPWLTRIPDPSLGHEIGQFFLFRLSRILEKEQKISKINGSRKLRVE